MRGRVGRVHGSRVSSQTAETKVERRIGWIPEQVAGDLEAGKSGRGARPDGWMLARARGRGRARQTLGCMRQVHTSSRPTGIQRLSTIQTRLSRSFAPSRFVLSPFASFLTRLSLFSLPPSLSFFLFLSLFNSSSLWLGSRGSLIHEYATTYRHSLEREREAVAISLGEIKEIFCNKPRETAEYPSQHSRLSAITATIPDDERRRRRRRRCGAYFLAHARKLAPGDVE